MKKVLLAALAVCAVFASCSNDNEDKTSNEPKTIGIQLPSNVVAAGRAIDAPVAGGLTTLTPLADVTVFLLNGNTVADVYILNSTEIGLKFAQIEQVSASVNGVLVVANIPSAVQTTVRALTSSTAIENYAYTTASQDPVSPNAGITGKLHMGKSTAGVTMANPTVGDTHTYVEYAVTLDAIIARFEFGDILPGVGVASINLHGVWINNYPATYADALVTPNPTTVLNATGSPFWVTAPTPNDMDMGWVVSPGSTSAPAYTPAEYNTNYDPSVDGVLAAYAFHLFAGNYVPHVLMLVSGQKASGYYNTAGTDDCFLGFVTFDKFNTGTALAPVWITAVTGNNIYKALGGITVDLKSITTFPEVGKNDVGIQITVAPWTAVNVIPGVQ